MKITKLSGNVGAQIDGVDLCKSSPEQIEAIRQALWDNGVVVFRDQALTPEAHIALAQQFGEIDVNRFFTPVAQYPMIAEVRTAASQTRVIGGTWHTDHSYDPAPAMCSILAARELPPYGGDTLFASQTAALGALSPGLRATLTGLRAWHSDGSFGADTGLLDTDASQFRPPVLHPVVIKHPQSGQAALYVNGDFTTHFDGWTKEESAPLLAHLYAFCSRPEFGCRISWQPGSVAIWDNRLVQHFACADYTGHSRLMHRITVKGQVLAAAHQA